MAKAPKYSSEIQYAILCKLVKHYLSAQEVIISYINEELKNNVSNNVGYIFVLILLKK